jgi:hypothetical protein
MSQYIIFYFNRSCQKTKVTICLSQPTHDHSVAILVPHPIKKSNNNFYFYFFLIFFLSKPAAKGRTFDSAEFIVSPPGVGIWELPCQVVGTWRQAETQRMGNE